MGNAEKVSRSSRSSILSGFLVWAYIRPNIKTDAQCVRFYFNVGNVNFSNRSYFHNCAVASFAVAFPAVSVAFLAAGVAFPAIPSDAAFPTVDSDCLAVADSNRNRQVETNCFDCC